MSDRTLITIGFLIPLITIISLLLPAPEKIDTFVYITQKTGLTTKCQLIEGKMVDCEQVIDEIWN
jgi:hypothetical protein